MSINNSIYPRNLVMSPIGCFYCKSENEVKLFLIDYLFGLKACKDHYENADNDCKIYMNQNKIVLFHDALHNQTIKKLLDYLENEFSIIRSNGNIDNGWKILKSKYYCFSSITDYSSNITNSNNTIHNSEWCIKIEKDNENESIVKHITLLSLLDNKLDYYKDEEFVNILNKSIQILDNGIYKEYLNTKLSKNIIIQI
uniref:Uncharacterized protein n=1 Tax=viral metagenome TaxID=1070528 RepID=A0A6C0GZ85_9ZZZZ